MTDAKLEESYRVALSNATKGLSDIEHEMAGVVYRVQTCSVFRAPNRRWTIKAVLRGTSYKDEVAITQSIADEFMEGCWEQHGADLAQHLVAATIKRMFEAEIPRVIGS